jgi:hypothetical protein
MSSSCHWVEASRVVFVASGISVIGQPRACEFVLPVTHAAYQRLLKRFAAVANRRRRRWLRVFGDLSVLPFAAAVAPATIEPL